VNDVRTANFVTICLLKNDFRAFLTHDERSKEECQKTREQFLAGDPNVIVCTDLLDKTLELPTDYMVNFSSPKCITDSMFIHYQL
jgi:superfamily II DNA/RNA helicase